MYHNKRLGIFGFVAVIIAVLWQPEVSAQPAGLQGPFVPLEVESADVGSDAWTTVKTTYWTRDTAGNDIYITDDTLWSPSDAVEQFETLIDTPFEGLTCSALVDLGISCEPGYFEGEKYEFPDLSDDGYCSVHSNFATVFPLINGTEGPPQSFNECVAAVVDGTTEGSSIDMPIMIDRRSATTLNIRPWRETFNSHMSDNDTPRWSCYNTSLDCENFLDSVENGGHLGVYERNDLSGDYSEEELILGLDGNNVIDSLKFNNPDTRRPTEVRNIIPNQAAEITNNYNNYITNWTTGDPILMGGATGVRQPLASPSSTSTGTESGTAFCSENPNALGCIEQGDVPDDVAIVSEEIPFNYEPVPLAGSNVCPDPKSITLAGGRNITFDNAEFCNLLQSSVSPVILALCALLGLYIVVGRRT